MKPAVVALIGGTIGIGIGYVACIIIMSNSG